MTGSTNRWAVVVLAGACTVALPSHAEDLQQKLAASKQAAALNQQALRSYSWLETTKLSYKGEEKSTKVEQCRYGPDGQVQKTTVVEPPPPEKKRGLRGKVVAKKTGEMKEDLEAAAALAHRYVPPDPGRMQAVIAAGTASLAQGGPGVVALSFAGYAKPGDVLTLTFDTAVKALRQIAVASWLDSPSQAVTLHVNMQALPDGTTYPGAIVLAIPSSNVEVSITKSNYLNLAR